MDLPYQSVYVEDFTSITGKGIKGKVNSQSFYVGSPNLFEELLIDGIPADIKTFIAELQNQGKTVMVTGIDEEVHALIAVADVVRDNSKAVLSKLHSLGIQMGFPH